MKISLDFDGVLANTMQSFLDKWNHDHHSHVCYNDISNWNFNENLGITSKVFYDYLKEAWSDWENLRPLESNLNLKVNNLTPYHQVDIVTSVSPSHISYVEKWLKKWNIGYNEIVNVNDKISLDYDLYIDDRPGLFEELHKYNMDKVGNGIGEKIKYGILYHQPWNSHLKFHSVMTQDRAYIWRDVIKITRAYEH